MRQQLQQEGRREGQQEGRREGQQEGRREGQQEGRLTATRAALRRVLAGRQLTSSRDDDARIDACADLATLERWLDRAINATSISDVLG
jgi:predicted transposase YdaD